MKKLSLFQKFDFSAWQTGKSFMVQSAKFNAKNGCVTLDVVIVEDKTNYGNSTISNIFEKFKKSSFGSRSGCKNSDFPYYISTNSSKTSPFYMAK